MFEPVVDICQHAIEQHGNILVTLLAAGVVGSFTHCAGMCGPFVLAQTTARLENIQTRDMNEWQRLRGAALLPYHFGRLTTYTVLGTIGAVLAQSVVMLSGFHSLNGILLALAGLMFIATGLKSARLSSFVQVPAVLRRLGDFFAVRASRFFGNPVGLRGYMLGVLLGFLPCGLLYSALFLASAYPPVTAALGMMLFALGTIPALFLISFGAGRLRRFRAALVTLGQVFMFANGAVLLILAGREFFV